MIDVILTPVKAVGMYLLEVLVDGSYYICLTASIGGLLAYISGFKNGGKLTTLGIVIYTTLQAILGALK